METTTDKTSNPLFFFKENIKQMFNILSNDEKKIPENVPLKSNKKLSWTLLLSVIIVTTVTYSNHFRNPFHFDDTHSIVNNTYIRDIKNIPLFFTDARTLSSLPQNQSYRPIMPLLYAVDYKIAGGLDTFYFHLSTFICYILQCILMYFLFIKILNQSFSHQWNKYIALFAVSWYALHTANAETINYISARSDSISTFFGILSLVIFIYFPHKRKFGIYLLPLIIGVLTKPSALVFPAIIFLYVLLFEENSNESKLNYFNFRKLFSALKSSALSWIICIALYLLQVKMTPETFLPGTSPLYNYIITQPFVWLHYFKTFFLPNELSADSDWSALNNILDYRFFVGCAFIICLLILAFRTSVKKETRPISFGIFWFFIALLPSSSIIPFAEVLNDHRFFFPNVGLVLSIVYIITFLFLKAQKIMESSFKTPYLIITGLIILFANAFGTHERNKVWSSGEKLWKDVTEKSPKNGRGWMNYGLALMGKADYTGAEKAFNKSLELTPRYHYLYTNMAILKAAQGDNIAAEKHFKTALELGPGNPNVYYFFGNFLKKEKRFSEAKIMFLKAIELSAGFIDAYYAIMEIYYDEQEWIKLKNIANAVLDIQSSDAIATNYLQMSDGKKSKIEVAEENAKINPSPQNFLNLSLLYYNNHEFQKCIGACKEAIRLKKDYAAAFNNICSACIQLGEWDKAIENCKKAIEIQADFQLAKNNLTEAKRKKMLITESLEAVKKSPTPEAYANLSLTFYNEKMYFECIEAAENSIKLKPSAHTYNIICSAYNNIGKYEDGIKACEQALKIQPDFQLAKNNLNWAKSRMNKK